jgi:hypothetical protein
MDVLAGRLLTTTAGTLLTMPMVKLAHFFLFTVTAVMLAAHASPGNYGSKIFEYGLI